MTRLSDLLQQHAPRKGELSLVTSTLGASSTWYAHHLLAQRAKKGDSVVFVSFAHEPSFHVDGVRKIGLDLSAPAYRGKCCIVDGFSTLFFAPPTTADSKNWNGGSIVASMKSGLANISKEIKTAIEKLPGTSEKHLMMLNAELLLPGAEVLSMSLLDEVMDWHSMVSSTTMFVAADSALLMNGKTKMENEHATFLLSLAHEASSTLSFRTLDTGLAKDVSGVLRLTDKRYRVEEGDGIGQGDKELLYYVKDTTAQVFGRGEHRS